MGSMPMAGNPTMPRCTVAIPVIHVSSAEAAAAFFRALGFEQQFVYRADPTRVDPSYMGFTRDDAQLHVSSFAGVSGLAVFIWVDDVDALREEFVAKGIPIIGPFDQTWGTRELSVRDSDSNTFCFGQRL
jgi:catechol 2,3-dioxygenase-like lactoylglutathione lyase family enzyme